MRRAPALAILTALAGAACSHAWDDYDPRLGGSGGGAQSGAGAGTPTSSAETTSSSGEPTTSSTSSPASSSSGDGGGGDGGGPTTVTSGGGSTSESSSSGTPTETLEVVTDQADCIDPTEPDPDECDETAANNAFTADGDGSPFNVRFEGFLRFTPGDAIAGRTIDAVQLRLRVAEEKRADSEDSGVVWETESFDRDSLFIGPPAQVGGAPVGASVGPVALGDEVTFDLVGLDVAADTPAYLSIVTPLEDGIDYLDERSATPPTLIITYH